MKARLESGKIVKYSQIPDTIVSGGQTYVNAKRLTESEQEELGFFDVIEPVYDLVTQVAYNLHFDNAYPFTDIDGDETTRQVFVYDIKDKTITKTLAELKTSQIEALKSLAYSKLSPTDWYAIRKAENGADIPSGIQTERDAIRTSVATKEVEINSLTTKASILRYDINF
tara:strand:+ start:42 stop:551 length:510 start_codon:yes stop_codon:yes gene_type:complete